MNKFINEILILNGRTIGDIYSQLYSFHIEMGITILKTEILPTDDGYVCAIGFYLDEELKEQYLEYKKKIRMRESIDEYELQGVTT